MLLWVWSLRSLEHLPFSFLFLFNLSLRFSKILIWNIVWGLCFVHQKIARPAFLYNTAHIVVFLWCLVFRKYWELNRFTAIFEFLLNNTHLVHSCFRFEVVVFMPYMSFCFYSFLDGFYLLLPSNVELCFNGVSRLM